MLPLLISHKTWSRKYTDKKLERGKRCHIFLPAISNPYQLVRQCVQINIVTKQWSLNTINLWDYEQFLRCILLSLKISCMYSFHIYSLLQLFLDLPISPYQIYTLPPLPPLLKNFKIMISKIMFSENTSYSDLETWKSESWNGRGVFL